eukprot:XP_008680508.1 spidroin-1-like [Zea mays]
MGRGHRVAGRVAAEAWTHRGAGASHREARARKATGDAGAWERGHQATGARARGGVGAGAAGGLGATVGRGHRGLGRVAAEAWRHRGAGASHWEARARKATRDAGAWARGHQATGARARRGVGAQGRGRGGRRGRGVDGEQGARDGEKEGEVKSSWTSRPSTDNCSSSTRRHFFN